MATQQNDRRVHDALLSALSGIKAKSFATRGTLSKKDSNIELGFTVEGIGEIKLPLEPDDAAWDKLKDKSQSKTDAAWVVDATKVSFAKQPLWDAWLGRIVSTTKRNFGIADGDEVVAEPYKLLIYEKDSVLETNQQSETSPLFFATLAVSLRSNYQGGTIRVSHCDQTKVFSTETHSWSRYQWFAWCTDAVHEMKPVTFGMRLLMVYRLRFTSLQPTYLVYNERDEEVLYDRARGTLERWTGKPSMLWFLLEHKYSLYFSDKIQLEDNDAIRFRALQRACQSLGYTLLLGQMMKDYWDDSYYESSGEWVEEEDQQWVKHVIRADGVPFCSKLEIVQSEIVQKYQACGDPSNHHLKEISSGRYEEHRFTAVLIVPPQSIPALRVRQWAASRETFPSITKISSATNPAIIFLKQQSLTLRKSGIRSIDPDLWPIMRALLDDFKEYENVCYASATSPMRQIEFEPPKSMFLTHDELETIATLSLKFGFSDLFQAACRLIVRQTGFSVERVSKLTKILGIRMSEFAEIDPANYLLGVCTKLMDTTMVCDKLLRSYIAAKMDSQLMPALILADHEYWHRFWYREAIKNWTWPLPQKDLKAMDSFAKILEVGNVLSDPSITSTAYAWIRQYTKSRMGISSSEILQVLNNLMYVIKRTNFEHTRGHCLEFLEAVHEASKGWSIISVNVDDVSRLIALGSKLGEDAIIKLKSLVHPDRYNRSFWRTMIFVCAAMDFVSWHRYLPKMLYYTVEYLFYNKKEIRLHRVSESDVRFVPPYKRVPYNEQSPTIAEIKCLIETIQTLKLDMVWLRLQCKLSSLMELDLDTLSSVLSAEELTRLKKYREDEVVRTSFGFPDRTEEWLP